MEEDFATAMVAAFSQKSPLSLSYSFVNYFLKRRDYQTANKHKKNSQKETNRRLRTNKVENPLALGLSYINSDGTFVWSDGTPFDFHYWAKHQPNNFRNEDFVHTLGSLRAHAYKWNNVHCSDCHKFTCKKVTTKIL